MKILALADTEEKALWDYYTPGMLKQYDLILSAGDLKSDYLTFLVTMANVPLLYVHGNHDGIYSERPPEGCECIDVKIVVAGGLRILGLGGALRYNNGPHQYSEKEMHRRIMRLRLKIAKIGGVDLILTHAAPAGYGDADDIAHRGFREFLMLLDRYSPQYLIHGHVHREYSHTLSRVCRYGNTDIINATGRYVLDISDK